MIPSDVKQCFTNPWLLLILAIVFAAGITAFGQSAASRGSISGTVTGPHGNAIPGAKVTVRNADLASERVVTTNEDGRFVVALLPSRPFCEIFTALTK
jgi:Carboxypeptidase regulatory-like domain